MTTTVTDTNDDWRCQLVSRETLAALPRLATLAFGWTALSWIHPVMSNCLDGMLTAAKLGLSPILVHGVRPDGSCTCHRGAGCTAIGKHPVARAWQTAPINVQSMQQAHYREPWLNLGLRMGTQPDGSRLFALDVDGPLSLLDPLTEKWGPLPPTLTAKTPRGFHLIYRWPLTRAMPRNSVRIAPGVDVRSEGGQIVAAPSRHRSGARYTWFDVREPAVLR